MFTETLERPIQTKPVTRPNPFLQSTLIMYLQQQPRDKPYHYCQSGGCELVRYFRWAGFDCFNLGEDFFDYNVPGRNDFVRASFPRQFDAIVKQEPHTIGAALERARAA